MRKSHPRRGPRLFRAGLATAAAVILVVAGVQTPAFATNTPFTITPSTGPLGGNTVIAVAGTNLLTGVTAPAARFIANATGTTTCPATLGTVSATNIAASAATKNTDNDGTVTTPNTLALGSYRVCLYTSSAAAAVLEGTSTTLYVVAAAAPVLSPSAGPVSGGNSITLTGPSGAPYLTTATTVGAAFTTASTCPATYTTTAPNIVASTVTRTSTSVATLTVPSGLALGTNYNICVYNGAVAGTSVLIGKSATAYGTLTGLTLSPTVGPSGGTNTITATAATAVLSGVTSPAVTFTEGSCSATYTGTGAYIPSTTVTKISNTKVVVLVPTGVVLGGGENTEEYSVCVYAGNTGTDALIAAPGSYTIAPTLTVTGVSPAGGPAQGGSLVTIAGGGFPYPADEDTVISASIGGAPLENIEVLSASAIRGTTTERAPGLASVSVTTAAGTKTLADAFTFSYGISVEPNTAPTNTTPYVDILGVGFDGLTFGTGNPNTGGARVFLVNDSYSNLADSGTPANYATPPVTECTGVLKIDDNEIICQLQLVSTLNPAGTVNTTDVVNGTYTIAVVSNSAVAATLTSSSVSIISSGSTFTVSPY
ncbi:IPT/TIG domain-containing protein [Jidongwangia harbinensis]|uniref:IPT/TIG domain-containing protein n=1 Tax=Jidongwangia harbinensis TaxID=2878561 RepID=UPI001CD997C6|nr:IPT/TIG domain-containing protein [Jidongwangia harbinensis]MCA2215926.1 IPT/TIG domain-containing protein [Jidongwangia harbinensis]